MVKVDLITGFLGAGKTTFLRRYVQHLLEKGEKVCILENDYGAVNVDTMLLADLEKKGVGIEMVAGGCDYDCHKRRFKTKLITMAMMGYDRVLIEPSGIFDVDEFFDILHEDPLENLYEIANVLTIVDVRLEDEVSGEVDYMLASQAAHAGNIILSHVDTVPNETPEKVISHINRALEQIKCKRSFSLEENVTAKPWEELKEADFQKIEKAGYRESSFEKRFSMDENGFQSLFFMNVQISKTEVLEKIKELFQDEKVGHVIRVKGFLEENGLWYEVNATDKELLVKEIQMGQEILIVIGERLNEEALDSYFPAKYATNHES